MAYSHAIKESKLKEVEYSGSKEYTQNIQYCPSVQQHFSTIDLQSTASVKFTKCKRVVIQ